MSDLPEAPTGLSEGGAQLWRDILADHELRPDELRLLADACREADLVDRLEEELRGQPLIAKGSQGQPVANPLVQELRQHRSVLSALLRGLKLPDADDREERGAADRSALARRAALARWNRPA